MRKIKPIIKLLFSFVKKPLRYIDKLIITILSFRQEFNPINSGLSSADVAESTLAQTIEKIQQTDTFNFVSYNQALKPRQIMYYYCTLKDNLRNQLVHLKKKLR